MRPGRLDIAWDSEKLYVRAPMAEKLAGAPERMNKDISRRA